MIFEKDQKRQLIRQNQQLKRQLEKAKGLISTLYREIEDLRNQLAKYDRQKKYSSPQTPKMKVEECFQSSSDEQQRQLESSRRIQNEQKSQSSPPKVRFKNNEALNLSTSFEKPGQLELRKANTKIILDSEEQVPRKSIQKLLKKSSERRRETDTTFDQNMSVKAVSARQIPLPMPFFKNDISSVRSEKALFKKITQSRPIFEHFFVTGMNKDGPCVVYNYPPGSSTDFSGYLSLIYGQNYLRQPDLSPVSSKSKSSINNILKDASQTTAYKRQTFVIPILKTKGQSVERDYLIICEAEDPVVQTRQSASYLYTRYYCFLSEWKFFSQFRKLSSSMIDRLQTRKRKREPFTEVNFRAQISQELQQSLSFLYQKSTDYNKTIDCCIGESGLRFSADVPPLQSSYQLIDKYLQTRLFNTLAYVKNSDQTGFETKLYGILLAYGLSETKMVLYSANKVRVSETLLQFLQLIRPLFYVNPIIVSAIRQEHQTYLDAPMGLILGLWSESRRSNKQKIQIFMNRKLNLAGLIEKAKITVNEGIVINLDTGLVFGGALSPKLNAIALSLNNLSLWKKSPKNLRDYYKYVQRMLAGRGDSEEGKAVWAQLMVYIKKTQLYCYYLENKQD